MAYCKVIFIFTNLSMRLEFSHTTYHINNVAIGEVDEMKLEAS
jgi:hypothetical protein